ncbi:hypothetical protein [Ruminococcus sp. YE282]|uniref:hypothetical protein n=1 Tax=Ruminococcus sp. YE282 TaxID=3158780 RepID=UPI00087E1F7F|nr:hypothetical protein [Ruminococcus bromii]SCY70710.1 hypothetical protein SAMN02910441_02128 [Ruminococcus bromii]
MKLFKLALFDLRRGIREEWIKLAFAFIVCIACCTLMFSQLLQYNQDNGINENISISVMDFILYNLRGMKLYSPNMDGQYLLPAVWMFNQVMIALIVGYYPVRDLNGYGKNTLLRTQSRSRWLLSKLVWIVCMVIAYYIVIYSASFIFALFTGNSLSFMPGEYITRLFYDIDLQDIYVENFVIFIITMPMLTSIVASIVQVMMSYIISPFISFLAIIVVMLSSTYISNPALIGNASMVIRSRFATPVGFTAEETVLYLAIYLIAALIIGFVYFGNKDILNKD